EWHRELRSARPPQRQTQRAAVIRLAEDAATGVGRAATTARCHSASIESSGTPEAASSWAGIGWPAAARSLAYPSGPPRRSATVNRLPRAGSVQVGNRDPAEARMTASHDGTTLS